MRGFAFIIVFALSLAGCVSPYLTAKLGRVGGTIVTMWVGADRFVYVPGKNGQNFAFETATTGRVIAPGLMFTDGGSIPRLAQIFKGLSSWGYGPAYIIHDWIFYGRHCYVDPDEAKYNDSVRFDDVNGKAGSRPITFDESALILAEAIKTLVDYGQVRDNSFAAEFVSGAVNSPIAFLSWDQEGACYQQRVTPFHIAVVWLSVIGEKSYPPSTWKLSAWEIAEAQNEFEQAKKHIKSLNQIAPPPDRIRTVQADRLAANQ